MAMRKWMGVAAGVAMMLGAPAPVLAAAPSEQQVLQLFEVLHVEQVVSQMSTNMAGMMAKMAPCVPASYWQSFADPAATQQLLGRMVPVYQRHFTAEDIAGLLKFYQSPLGKKVITEMPQTMAEGMQIGQVWGRARGEAMVKALQQKGALDTQGRCPASPAAGGPALKLGK